MTKKEFIDLNLYQKVQALKKHPEFENIMHWSLMKGMDWLDLLRFDKKYAVYCDWADLSSLEIALIVRDVPELYNKFDVKRATGMDWSIVLSKHPEFEAYCIDWSKLDGGAWANLLIHQPKFENKCDWDKLNGEQWVVLLSKRTKYADKCDWNKLTNDDWKRLLYEQKQFLEYYKMVKPFEYEDYFQQREGLQ